MGLLLHSDFFWTLSLPSAVCLCPRIQPTSVCQNTVSADLLAGRSERSVAGIEYGPICLQSLVAYIFSPQLWLREVGVKERTSLVRGAICDKIRLKLCAHFIGLKHHFCSYSGWNRDGEDSVNQNVKDVWGIVLRFFNISASNRRHYKSRVRLCTSKRFTESTNQPDWTQQSNNPHFELGKSMILLLFLVENSFKWLKREDRSFRLFITKYDADIRQVKG